MVTENNRPYSYHRHYNTFYQDTFDVKFTAWPTLTRPTTLTISNWAVGRYRAGSNPAGQRAGRNHGAF
jgi:hypothetical protein